MILVNYSLTKLQALEALLKDEPFKVRATNLMIQPSEVRVEIVKVWYDEGEFYIKKENGCWVLYIPPTVVITKAKKKSFEPGKRIRTSR